MIYTGYERSIDDDGRIAIPQSVLEMVYDKDNRAPKKMHIHYDCDGKIILTPFATEEVKSFGGVTDEIREMVLNYLEVDAYSEKDYDCYSGAFYAFYSKCREEGLHHADADRYAILNTMFDYDIGMDAAMAINNWMYEHSTDIYDVSANSVSDKAMIALAVCELGLNLDFSNWIKEDYEEYKFFEM